MPKTTNPFPNPFMGPEGGGHLLGTQKVKRLADAALDQGLGSGIQEVGLPLIHPHKCPLPQFSQAIR